MSINEDEAQMSINWSLTYDTYLVHQISIRPWNSEMLWMQEVMHKMSRQWITLPLSRGLRMRTVPLSRIRMVMSVQ